MTRGKNSKKKQNKGKKKGNTKKKGGVYQMGGENEVKHYTATYEKGNIENGITVKSYKGGDGSGSAVVGDSFTKIEGYLIAEYNDKTDVSKGFKKIDEDLKKELENICKGSTTPVVNATANGNPTKFSELLEDDKIKGILTFAHTDRSNFLSLERNDNEDFIAIKIYIGADTNSGNTPDKHISSTDNEHTIYVIESGKIQPNFT
jgi:hypothetical protein